MYSITNRSKTIRIYTTISKHYAF